MFYKHLLCHLNQDSKKPGSLRCGKIKTDALIGAIMLKLP